MRRTPLATPPHVCVCVAVQLWDIRDGMCKQTFTGHESDINAITVRSRSFFSRLDTAMIVIDK